MSAFLGPIHFWLYHKIQLQEELIRELASSAEAAGWQTPEPASLRKRFATEELRPLNELIDVSNIHGWLQDRIHDAESRYAGLVTELLKSDPSRRPVLLDAAYTFGKAHAIDADSDAADAYRKFEDSFLNGMPCDRINVLTAQDAGRCAWTQEADIHAGYWEAVGGEPENYYLLREKIMEGMLSESRLSLSSSDRAHYMLECSSD